MKAAIIKTELIDIPDDATIPAGVMSVVHVPPFTDDYDVPDFTIEGAGQYLSREFYPELHSDYLHTGGFHQFQVPNLERKFLMGFDKNSQAILGTGVIYFQTFPPFPSQHE